MDGIVTYVVVIITVSFYHYSDLVYMGVNPGDCDCVCVIVSA